MTLTTLTQKKTTMRNSSKMEGMANNFFLVPNLFLKNIFLVENEIYLAFWFGYSSWVDRITKQTDRQILWIYYKEENLRIERKSIFKVVKCRIFRYTKTIIYWVLHFLQRYQGLV